MKTRIEQRIGGLLRAKRKPTSQRSKAKPRVILGAGDAYRESPLILEAKVVPRTFPVIAVTRSLTRARKFSRSKPQVSPRNPLVAKKAGSKKKRVSVAADFKYLDAKRGSVGMVAPKRKAPNKA
jgi:hypothetical protein